MLAGIGELQQLDNLFASCLQMSLQAARHVYAAEQAMTALLVSQPCTLLAAPVDMLLLPSMQKQEDSLHKHQQPCLPASHSPCLPVLVVLSKILTQGMMRFCLKLQRKGAQHEALKKATKDYAHNVTTVPVIIAVG